MNRKEIAKKATELLEYEYPDAACSLTYEKPYELLIAVRLSAQCTDARVNLVTPALFGRYQSLQALAGASYEEIEELVKSCGFFRTKAHDIVELSKMLIADYDSVVPSTMEELLKLPGVGRKTANLVLGDVYGIPAVVCDTHCIRITNLLGLSTSKNPLKTEKELRECLPLDKASDFCHRLVLHGRAVCVARKPKCDLCVLNGICAHVLEMAKPL
ncbi:MAG: endonuclease III [Oscillospiraceae bacterium]